MSKHAKWAGPLFEGHSCSIGYEVLDWITEYTCHGVGDIQGERFEGVYDLDDEIRQHVIDAYEIDPVTGRRLRKETMFSRAKGRAKSELAAIISIAEGFGPVRFDGWDADGQPVARPVVHPLIKCAATEEGQAGNTFGNIAFIAGEWGRDVFPDVYGGSSGIRNWQAANTLYLPGGGEIRAVTSGAASKDGGLESFVVFDETHLYTLPELRRMYSTIVRNLGKRKAADAWAMQTTTAYRPGENSVAEATLTAWRKGELGEDVLVDHREGRGRIDLDDKARTIRQLREAYGPAAEWIDLDRKYSDMRDPRVCPDEETAARYFLNRPLSSKDAWIPASVVDRQAREELVADGEPVTLGFDGSLNDDSTVLIGSRLSDGFIFTVGVWEKPDGPAGNFWEVPRLDVVGTIHAAFAKWDVRRMYADPHEWRSEIDTLAETYPGRVAAWTTSAPTTMSAALDRLRTDLLSGGPAVDGKPSGRLFHDGHPRLVEHLKNAYVAKRGLLTLVRKEHPKSSRKIDSTVGAALAYEARADTLTAQEKAPAKTKRVSHAMYGFN